MITLIQIDKSGTDIFEKDYSIALIVNKEEIYGINIPQQIKDAVMNKFKREILWKLNKDYRRDKLRLVIRFHTSVVILLIKKVISDMGYMDEVNIEICNDFDGHFHEIKEMIYRNIFKLIPSLKPEDIVQTKFHKPSLVDTVARNLRNKVKEEIKKYNLLKIDAEELTNIIKK